VLHGSTALKVGMKLHIPAGGSSSGESTAVASHDPVATSGGLVTEHEYVVKSGDTLWAIAKSEMGSDKCVADIKAANEDVLHGSTALKVGMKLKIPAKK
jgi:LysM repeat protein